jgi:hypothetical protein
MAKIGQQIVDKAFEILEHKPEGVHHAELIRRIEAMIQDVDSLR